jgi:hypothetical protein
VTIDRERWQGLDAEQRRMLSRDLSIEDKLRLGQRLSASAARRTPHGVVGREAGDEGDRHRGDEREVEQLAGDEAGDERGDQGCGKRHGGSLRRRPPARRVGSLSI